MAMLPAAAFAQDFEWKGECDAEWFTVCDVGPCPTDPDKRHYKNNWGKEGCSPELEFPGPPSRVDLKGANVELVHENNVEIRSLVSGGHFLLSRPLNVTESAHLGDFTLVAHSLTAGGAITIAGDFNWRGGDLIGTSDVTVRNAVNMTSLGAKTLNVPRLVCEGPIQWRDTGDIQLFGGAVLENRLTMTVRNDEWISGNGGTLLNNGTFSKLDSFAATQLFETIRFVNGETGAIDVQSGALLLDGGGESRGAIGLAADTTLQLNGRGGKPFIIADDTAIGGEGLVWISGTGPGLVVADRKECSARNVLLTGSLRADGPTYFDSMTWQGGTVEGSAPVEISEELLLPAGLACTINGGKLRNAPGSIAEWSGSGELRILAGGEFRNGGTLALLGPQKRLTFGNSGEKLINEAEGALIVQADTIFGFGQPGSVVNEGVFNILAPTAQCEFTSGTLLESSHIVNLGAGTLMLRGGASTGGLIDISPGTVLVLQSQSFAVSDTQFPGTGLLRIGAGALDVKTPTTIPNVELANAAGSVTGPAPLTVTGKLDFLAGTMNGQGQTVSRGGMTLRGTSDKTLSERTLVNEQQATWRDSGRIVLSNGAVFDNDGTFQAASDAVIAPVSGGGTFNNDGTFKKAGSAGVTNIQTVFDNAGTTSVDSGTLRLTGGGTSEGKFTIAAGAALEVAARDYILEDGAESTGAGPLKVISGSVTAAEGATARVESFRLAGGMVKGQGNLTITRAFEWVSGDIAGPAPAVVRSEGTLNMDGAGSKRVLAGTFVNAGEATADVAVVILNEGAIWENSGRLTMKDHNGFSRQFGATGKFNNRGVLEKNGANRESKFFSGVEFNNLASGVVNVIDGDLLISGGGSSRGSFFLADDRTVFFEKDYTFEGGCRFVGLGSPWIIDGVVATLAGPVEAQNLTLTGRIDGPGELKVGTLGWGNGTMSGSGTTIVERELSMGGEVLSLRRSLQNLGRAVWSFGTLNITDVAFDNRGTFVAFRENFGELRVEGFGVAQFINRGLFQTQRGLPNHVVSMDVNFVNTGTVEAIRGKLVFKRDFTQTSGAIRVMKEGLIEFERPVRFAGGTIGANSQVNVTRLTNEGGVLKPGESPGIFTLVGDLEQLSEGSIEIELAGYAPGDEYDVLVITGDAALGGTLDVRLLDGFEPLVGDTFTVITHASSTGVLDNVLAPCGYEFAVHYNPTDVTLEVTAVGVPTPGDLDGDCDVDLADYRRFFDCITGPGGGVPQGCEPADLTNNGQIALDDVAAFQRVFTGS